ncbi:MAG: DUF1127 domain-containing protein [Parafilimonas terrae]|nr:DUF1127 domain-containing protein [Parafilimonas terrae]
MLVRYLQSLRKARIAARNYRILSALDDEALLDIGLDRGTLRAFCDAGCSPVAGPVVSRPISDPAALAPAALASA